MPHGGEAYKLSEHTPADDIPFFMHFLAVGYLVLPTILAVIVFVYPNALNDWFYDTKHCTYEEVKEMDEEE